MFSDDYKKWVNWSKKTNLTNNQHKFAEFLLKNEVMVNTLGDMQTIFTSIREWLKKNKPENNEKLR